MSRISSLKKKCRVLEERKRWQELSDTLDTIGTILRDSGNQHEALEYFDRERNLCESEMIAAGEARGKLLDS